LVKRSAIFTVQVHSMCVVRVWAKTTAAWGLITVGTPLTTFSWLFQHDNSKRFNNLELELVVQVSC
jgi:hypothetical protein